MGKALSVMLLALSTVPGDLPFSRWFTAHAHGIEVQIARVRGGQPWLKGVAEVAAPPGRVFALVMDFRRYPAVFGPPLETAEVLERDASVTKVRLRWREPRPWDAVVLYRSEKEPGGVFVLRWESPPSLAGETRIEPVGQSRCRVSYTFLAAKGEDAAREEPVLYIRSLRRGLGLSDPPRAEGGHPVY